jgi:hypothetical protein
MAERKREQRNRSKKQEGVLGLQGFISLSLLFHGGVGLARIGGHTTTPAKPCERYMIVWN